MGSVRLLGPSALCCLLLLGTATAMKSRLFPPLLSQLPRAPPPTADFPPDNEGPCDASLAQWNLGLETNLSTLIYHHLSRCTIIPIIGI